MMEGQQAAQAGSGSRQSSTRWTPTSDQIRILKDLYYNNGVRSPSADQIQRISARLREYGKIEGKNVFYWFQNHKARERQKKRFTTDPTLPTMQRPGLITNANAAHWKNEQHLHTSTGISSSSSAGMLTVGQVGNNYGYGSVPMEKSFRDCSISAGGGGSSGHVGINHHNLEWVGTVDPYASTYTTFFDKIRPNIGEEEEEEEEEEQEEEDHEIETLPLFPMHGEDIHGYCNLRSNSSNYDAIGWYQNEDGGIFKNGSRASLELSLNSYSRKSPDFA